MNHYAYEMKDAIVLYTPCSGEMFQCSVDQIKETCQRLGDLLNSKRNETEFMTLSDIYGEMTFKSATDFLEWASYLDILEEDLRYEALDDQFI